MSLTCYYITSHHHIGLSYLTTNGQSCLPMNVTVCLDDNVEVNIISTNANGLLFYPTHLVPILSPAAVPEQLIFLAAEHNLNLGTDLLLFVLTTGFGHVTLTELLATSAYNPAVAQPQPNVTA